MYRFCALRATWYLIHVRYRVYLVFFFEVRALCCLPILYIQMQHPNQLISLSHEKEFDQWFRSACAFFFVSVLAAAFQARSYVELVEKITLRATP